MLLDPDSQLIIEKLCKWNRVESVHRYQSNFNKINWQDPSNPQRFENLPTNIFSTDTPNDNLIELNSFTNIRGKEILEQHLERIGVDEIIWFRVDKKHKFQIYLEVNDITSDCLISEGSDKNKYIAFEQATLNFIKAYSEFEGASKG